MAMLNYKQITQAIESILKAALGENYIITRNEERNVDPSAPLRKGDKLGLINILRGPIVYNAYCLAGGTIPWLVDIKPIVEIQASSMLSGDEAEDKLQDAEKAVLDVLTVNKKLNGTVAMTNGYHIQYEYNAHDQIYHHASIITLQCQSRS